MNRMIYDFDLKLQETFNENFLNIPNLQWKNWLDVTSKEDYEELVFKNSGLPKKILNDIKTTLTKPSSISVDANLALKTPTSKPIFICHTSGTSGGKLSQLKWYHFSDKMIRKQWAPGMKAIFEHSGLNKDSTAVIFVPSRLQNDGLYETDGIKMVRLYTSEFSQRLILSIIKPKSYLIDFYKNSRNISTINRLFSLKNISVVSAPYKTILGWIDTNKIRNSLKKALKSDELNKGNEDYEDTLVEIVRDKGVEKGTKIIQERLKKKLSKATLIFSATGLSDLERASIRKFFEWEKGNERYTDLYVGSETGPFAASIDPEDKKNMVVFPLTLPAITRKGKIDLLSRSSLRFGKLLVSKMDEKAIVNLDTGDIITVVERNGIPRIDYEILRSGFEIKQKIKPIGIPRAKKVYAGDYFELNDFEIHNPRKMISCIYKEIKRDFDYSNPVFLVSGRTSKLVFPLEKRDLELLERKKKEIGSCHGGVNLDSAFEAKKLELEVGKTGIKTEITQDILLKSVHDGYIPKGVLKKWPFYHVVI